MNNYFIMELSNLRYVKFDISLKGNVMKNKNTQLPDWFQIVLSLSIIYICIIFFYLKYWYRYRFSFETYLSYILPVILINILLFLWKNKLNIFFKNNKERISAIFKVIKKFIIVVLILSLLISMINYLDKMQVNKVKNNPYSSRINYKYY